MTTVERPLLSSAVPTGDNGLSPVRGVDNPPLHALKSGQSGGERVYTYTATGAFPTESFKAANHWGDVVLATGGGG